MTSLTSRPYWVASVESAATVDHAETTAAGTKGASSCSTERCLIMLTAQGLDLDNQGSSVY